MKLVKIQQEILKAVMANPENVSRFGCPGNETFITADHAVGYVIPWDKLRVNLDGTNLMKALDLQQIVDEGDKLVGTDLFRNGGTARFYKYANTSGGAEGTHVDTRLLKLFDFPTLYQNPMNPRGVIVVTETPIDGPEAIVGIVMPCKVEETDDDEEDWQE